MRADIVYWIAGNEPEHSRIDGSGPAAHPNRRVLDIQLGIHPRAISGLYFLFAAGEARRHEMRRP